jgi:hypothetical protein
MLLNAIIFLLLSPLFLAITPDKTITPQPGKDLFNPKSFMKSITGLSLNSRSIAIYDAIEKGCLSALMSQSDFLKGISILPQKVLVKAFEKVIQEDDYETLLKLLDYAGKRDYRKPVKLAANAGKWEMLTEIAKHGDFDAVDHAFNFLITDESGDANHHLVNFITSCWQGIYEAVSIKDEPKFIKTLKNNQSLLENIYIAAINQNIQVLHFVLQITWDIPTHLGLKYFSWAAENGDIEFLRIFTESLTDLNFSPDVERYLKSAYNVEDPKLGFLRFGKAEAKSNGLDETYKIIDLSEKYFILQSYSVGRHYIDFKAFSKTLSRTMTEKILSEAFRKADFHILKSFFKAAGPDSYFDLLVGTFLSWNKDEPLDLVGFILENSPVSLRPQFFREFYRQTRNYPDGSYLRRGIFTGLCISGDINLVKQFLTLNRLVNFNSNHWFTGIPNGGLLSNIYLNSHEKDPRFGMILTGIYMAHLSGDLEMIAFLMSQIQANSSKNLLLRFLVLTSQNDIALRLALNDQSVLETGLGEAKRLASEHRKRSPWIRGLLDRAILKTSE